MHGPSPDTLYPLAGFPRAVFLKNVITRPNIIVGDYSYYDDPDGAERFEERNVLHHHAFLGDRLIIGRFTAIASGTRFIMNGANHAMGGFSTYPFNIFGNGWETGFDPATWTEQSKGDTVIGNDVWIGMDSMIMPGVTIGDGAIIASGSVITSHVAPYTIAGGNPGRAIRKRFDDGVIAELLEIAWWDWSARKISASLDAIRGGDIAALRAAAAHD
ncbi:chloramphenicol acetyltransferase [Zhengella mangrovi]|uniref:Chloramphenicol acetyltransferase n=1 Tax=Zhengella mangrovi TaxID=1982044 RepID=A0A2G1QH23_9HYPH|nr:CatB-related O-acetyltransferase [Zhengella mangrovi]PHP64812.1 chloramphenicol acetyltransferase [Zhengella mangrovi]